MLGTWVRETELKQSTIHQTVQDLKRKCTTIEMDLKVLSGCLEDAGWRSRRQNVKLVGVLERGKGQDVKLFVEDWLVKTALQGRPSQFFSVKRAHKMPLQAKECPPTDHSSIDEL
ncbi:hypothetical protein NDU88_006981 [Pleurodeles waltl]|uniref:Uncharacterized protein n=1 Tax=Pleurodeles waltl TaxID=8319 RepID=A0AAV7N0W3_PLEWA|nr:hypothetical protein NDU88_006981 [Pleurodeles waltl]